MTTHTTRWTSSTREREERKWLPGKLFGLVWHRESKTLSTAITNKITELEVENVGTMDVTIMAECGLGSNGAVEVLVLSPYGCSSSSCRYPLQTLKRRLWLTIVLRSPTHHSCCERAAAGQLAPPTADPKTSPKVTDGLPCWSIHYVLQVSPPT